MNARALPSTGWLPCSDRSLERHDPLAGTSGLGKRWFLIEVDGAWGDHALLRSRLEPELARRLVTKIESARMRPLAIRRTGRRADERRGQSSWRWAIVDSRAGHESVRWGAVDDPQLLLEVPLDGSTGVPSDEPVICVCTHARHDQCCAVRGRPVVTALAREFPDATWECSHLGGDRFAATMIVFPEGLHYGRVTAATAGGIMRRYRNHEIDPKHFRGRSSLPNVVQAAEAFARERLHDDRIDAFRLLDAVPLDAEGGASARSASTPGSAPEWRVQLQTRNRIVTVDLAETLSTPMLTTCASTVTARVREFSLVSVDVA